ncbi:hypothetical protein DJ013_03565 [Arcticibacterium luteifluviistationis]|uniref:Uncharacterized protein n=2 Tax=Arcticibacterium luteifluviistationis TaxID=1784714 RepID=A0A2Z4G872_9BACT|nr:hypothetical protein DJ013_03565 [Arcticibacterium luteifluviistationis]
MKLKNNLPIIALLTCLMICGLESFSQKNNTPELYLEPIFKVNYGDATADKPQSKSWTNEYGQWVLIGDEDGPKLLKKDASGWTSQTELNHTWKDLPSRADVWSKGDQCQIVLVEDCVLTVVQIAYSKNSEKYKYQWKVDLPITADCNSIETATITQDSKGEFWVCADVNEKIMVWHSLNGEEWSNPFTIADSINLDDISLIVALQNQVSVIWSDQNTQSINERIHSDGDAMDKWSDRIIVQEGDNNADDHLNATVFENGRMAMATKNSVDEMNQPQFVLRIRELNGQWTNTPYENLMPHRTPSRPIINHVESGKIFEIHAVRNRVDNRYFISVNEIVEKNGGWEFKELIQLKTKIRRKNGDVTSSKASFLPDGPKLIFFSDELGNVYSFDLDSLL